MSHLNLCRLAMQYCVFMFSAKVKHVCQCKPAFALIFRLNNVWL